MWRVIPISYQDFTHSQETSMLNTEYAGDIADVVLDVARGLNYSDEEIAGGLAEALFQLSKGDEELPKKVVDFFTETE